MLRRQQTKTRHMQKGTLFVVERKSGGTERGEKKKATKESQNTIVCFSDALQSVFWIYFAMGKWLRSTTRDSEKEKPKRYESDGRRNTAKAERYEFGKNKHAEGWAQAKRKVININRVYRVRKRPTAEMERPKKKMKKKWHIENVGRISMRERE